MSLHRTFAALVVMFAAAVAGAQEPEGTLRLIVELRQPASAGRMRVTSEAMVTRRAALEQRMSDLRRDLPRLARAARAGAIHVAAEPVIGHSYHRVLFGVSVRVPAEMRASLAALPYVAAVHEDRTCYASWDSVAAIQAPQVWTQFGTRGAGVTVAIIDSGIDYRHAAFGNGIGPGFKIKDGWDFVDNDADPMDTFGHGTHVAGIVAANGGGLTGVAPEASLIAYRALTGPGGNFSDVIAAIERSADPNEDDNPADHVDIVNMSLGGTALDGSDPVVQAVENATAAGVLFCIAAGNTSDYGNVQTPGIAPSAITAGASDSGDHLADFSSRGPSLFYTMKPEVVAPGVGIRSAYLDGAFNVLSGTSMAAPHVAGVAALVKAVHPSWTPAEIKEAIVTTAVDDGIEVMSGGAGRVDALRATRVDLFASPAVLSFGRDEPAATTWSSTQAVTLHNVSTSARTLTSTVTGLRAGIAVTLDRPSVTLDAGASTTVQVHLSVDNSAVPAPQEGSLSYGGRIEWTGASVPVRVAWAFVKGTILTVNVDGAEHDSIVNVLGAQRQRETARFYGSTRILWPLERVDVVVVEASPILTRASERIVTYEQVDTASTTQLTAHMADARFSITDAAVDEHGAPMVNAQRDCKDQLILAFPTGRRFSREQFPELQFLVGPVSNRVRVYVSGHCVDPAAGTLYTAILEARNGLDRSLFATSHAPWVRHDIALAGSPPVADFVYPTVRLPGDDSTWFMAEGARFAVPSPDHFTIYSAGSAPDADLVTIVSKEPLGTTCPKFHIQDATGVCRLDAAFLYLADDLLIDGELYREPSPMAHHVPAGNTAIIGGGPLWGRLWFLVTDPFFTVVSSWRGALGERREVLPPTQLTVYDGVGYPIGDGGADAYYTHIGMLSGDKYRIEGINTNLTVAGAPAKSTVRALFDTRRADFLAPQFTGMRIVDAHDQPAVSLEGGAAASLLFSAVDETGRGYAPARLPPNETATRVEFRTSDPVGADVAGSAGPGRNGPDRPEVRSQDCSMSPARSSQRGWSASVSL